MVMSFASSGLTGHPITPCAPAKRAKVDKRPADLRVTLRISARSGAVDEGQAHGPAPQKTAGSSPADPKSAGPLAGPLTLTTHSLHYGGGATTPVPVIL